MIKSLLSIKLNNSMRNICIIPARGGSKRIPRKNIKDFLGKPIIAYSIEVALSSKLFEEVMVSTDDDEIAEIAKKYGANVPFIRPAELADDYTPINEVINNTLQYYQDQGITFNYVCTIFATAPLINEKYLIGAYIKLKESDAINAFSVTSMTFPIQRTFRITKQNRCEMFWPENFYKRSQDLEEAYHDAGMFYWTKANQKSDHIYFEKDSIPIILPPNMVQDIDSLEDWRMAEIKYRMLNNL